MYMPGAISTKLGAHMIYNLKKKITVCGKTPLAPLGVGVGSKTTYTNDSSVKEGI